MTLKLPPRFVNMPAGTVFDAHLPDALFRTLAQLHGLAWQTKGERTPPATVAEFARLRGLKERRMYDHLRELKEQGFIRVENLGHNRIVIFPLRWEPGAALPVDKENLFCSTDESKTHHNNPNQLFTAAKAAAILNVSLKTLNNWLREGHLPHTRLGDGGRLVRIRQQDLEEFIDRNYTK